MSKNTIKIILLSVLDITMLILVIFFFIIPPKGDEHLQIINESDGELSLAEQEGKDFAHSNCRGSGSVEITHTPMDEDDFSFIIPYGLVVGAHVTPIDHQYFSPTIFNSPRDTYEVRAVADGTIIQMDHRNTSQENLGEYRLIFSHTCTFFTYFDLVTSLIPELETFFEGETGEYSVVYPNYEVKAGDLIGYIGGQTLDFAVWDFEKPLDGFIYPEHYQYEPWKVYTADPYDYYSDEIMPLMIEKNIRVAEPIAGEIDHDIEGRLIGNWFLENTNWYGGIGTPYYSGHLSIAPEHIDPTATVISIGNYDGDARQFLANSDNPDPSEVSIENGLVKYDLMDWEYILQDGSSWDRDSLEHGISAIASTQNNGCALFQVLNDNKLKAEFFPNINCKTLSDFTESFLVYER